MPCSGCSALHGVNPNKKKKNSIDTAFDESNFDPVQDSSKETLLMGLLEAEKERKSRKKD